MGNTSRKILAELVEMTDAFLEVLSHQEALGDEEMDALKTFIISRQRCFEQLNPAPLEDPEEIELGLRLDRLNRELSEHLNREHKRIHTEMVGLQKGRKAHRGYLRKPLRKRRTIELEG